MGAYYYALAVRLVNQHIEVDVWIKTAFSAIAQSEHSDGVLNSCHNCKIK